MAIADVKNEIKDFLGSLVSAGDLGGATTLEFKKDPFDYELSASQYPHAYLTPPTISSTRFDNRTLIRTYTFTIMVIEQVEHISGATQIETLMETIMDKFDNSLTINGTADAGVFPTTSQPEVFEHRKRQFVVFDIILEARQCVPLTFTT